MYAAYNFQILPNAYTKKSTGSPEYAKTKEVIKLSSTVDNWEQVLLIEVIPHHPDNVISNIFTFWSEI
jgi:hypothetical protein